MKGSLGSGPTDLEENKDYTALLIGVQHCWHLQTELNPQQTKKKQKIHLIKVFFYETVSACKTITILLQNPKIWLLESHK